MKTEQQLEKLLELQSQVEEMINIIKKKDDNRPITERVKSFEDACEIEGKDPKEVLPYKDPKNKDEIAINAFTKLNIIIRVLNENHIFNWLDSNEYKWYPYFEYKSGFGFSLTDYVCWAAGTIVGSRLCFKTEALAKYAGKQFENIYNEYLSQ